MPQPVLKSSLENGDATRPDDQLAARLRGFGLFGIIAILVILAGNLVVVPLSSVLVLIWAWRSRTPWREIGFLKPNSWVWTVTVGIIFGSAFKLLVKALVMPLLGAPATNQAYHFLAGNRAAIPATLFALIVGAGFGEETVFRGYMFERFSKLFGRSIGAKVSIVLLSSVWFALVHYPVQGLPGVEQAMITGLAFGTIFARTGRLWIPMVAHAAFDLTAYALIYWNLESNVSHWILK